MADGLHPAHARVPAEGVQGMGDDGPASNRPELLGTTWPGAETASGGDDDSGCTRRHGLLGGQGGYSVQRLLVVSRPAINMMWRMETMILKLLEGTSKPCGQVQKFCCGALASVAELANV
jgi:hypothetical protein